jgi:uncharacterized protein YgbK (DUF1537 family)
MPSRPLIVLADDLTGAAEVAAIAHQAGLRAVVLTRLPVGPVDAEVLVFDTDTRLSSPAQAARRVRTVLARLAKQASAGFFLKVDSVLRGPVTSQLEACAQSLGRRRTLLVPANPSLGRVIRDGRYFIGGIPLHDTEFSLDPHHPRTTSDVRKLLGAMTRAPLVSRAPTARSLPRSGIVVGETGIAADVLHWADRLDSATLPAGGADFFRAWLLSMTGERRNALRYTLPTGASLLLHGTTAAPASAESLRFRGRQPPATATVAATLQRDGFAAITATTATLHDPGAPAAISRGFAVLAQRLHATSGFHHLLIAGGATASSVLQTLGWSSLKVARVWGPGVVTLQPVNDREFAVTLKPGSYPWPASLCHVFQGRLPK